MVEELLQVYDFFGKGGSETSHVLRLSPMNPLVFAHDKCHGRCKKDVTPHTILTIPFVIR